MLSSPLWFEENSTSMSKLPASREIGEVELDVEVFSNEKISLKAPGDDISV